MELLLYSCYSLNKIVTIRGGSVDSGTVLQKVFPISTIVFSKTDNPEILWPLVNLISTLITKCQFDTTIIINSIESSSLNKLIMNESEVLNEALCDMFKNFLCIIPRNKPAQAVFQLVYHFLNYHIPRTDSSIHEKIIHLWYISIREFSSVNNCSAQYYELFQNHFKRCLFRKTPTILYILEEYMLLRLIEADLNALVEIVYEFYQEAEEL